MGVTSLGPHIRPGCHLGHSRFFCFCNKYVDLYTVCVFYGLPGNARGLGLTCVCVPLVPRFYAVLQNYAKYAAPPLGWGHVTFMPIFGSFDVIEVTWAKYSMLIGREKFCCAVIGRDLLETPLLLLFLAFFARQRLPVQVFC